MDRPVATRSSNRAARRRCSTALSLLIVFLCLAALYESWTIPLAVILVVPLGIVGAVLGAKLTGLDNNIYLQVGLITTMGLGAKNAILIVEFAEERMRAGADCVEAAVEGGQAPASADPDDQPCLRLRRAAAGHRQRPRRRRPERDRPGGRRRHPVATFLAIFFVPLFFVFVKQVFSPAATSGRGQARRSFSPPPAE